jgi:hypothetical protein
MITLVTLGPTGTCHERAAIEYMGFQGVEDFEIELIGDFFDGLERIRGRDDAFLIQCSAHPKVHEITETHWTEVFVVDTFIYPTKALAVLTRREVERPRTLGLVPATAGYIDRRRASGGALRGGADPPRARRAASRGAAGRPRDRGNRHDVGGLRDREAFPRGRDRDPVGGAVPQRRNACGCLVA